MFEERAFLDEQISEISSISMKLDEKCYENNGSCLQSHDYYNLLRRL